MRAIAIVLCLCWSVQAYANDPVFLEPGDEVPYAGVLLTTPDAAKLAADLINTRALLRITEQLLGECIEAGDEAVDSVLLSCSAELTACLKSDPVVRVIHETTNTIPWYFWLGGGILLTGAFIAGFAAAGGF